MPQAMNTFPEHFVCLPIIVTDYDAFTSTESDGRAPSQASNRSPGIEDHSYTPNFPNWQTGFTQYADNLWSSMTLNMRKKLREACVEVLRRTGEQEEERITWEYDDDTRYLD